VVLKVLEKALYCCLKTASSEFILTILCLRILSLVLHGKSNHHDVDD